jgi:flagellar basal body-associated protein FliL
MQKEKKKINLVDIIIIVLILAVALFFGMKFFGGSKATATKSDINFTVLVQGVPKQSLDDVKKTLPAKQIADGKYIDCEVKSVESSPSKVDKIEKTNTDPYVKTTVLPDQNDEYVDLTFTMNAKVVAASLLTEVGTQEVRVGRSFIIKAKDFELTGTVLTLNRADSK